jgi:IclR family mhp operon transcriptional activator
MDSTRPIRALVRGLDALTFLNSRGGATVSEIAQAVGLPRTTVYRIVETLGEAGLVHRDRDDERFHVTIAVRGLSAGFADEDWVARIAAPRIEELGNELVWPICITTPSGKDMMVRATTDHGTPLAIEKISAGIHIPMLTSAAGRVYLAHCPAAQRDELLRAAGRAERDELSAMLPSIRALGFASVTRSHHLMDAVALSVPAPLNDHELAAVTVRFVASVVSLPAAIERFLPKLQRCAARIGADYSQLQAAARAGDSPRAAV